MITEQLVQQLAEQAIEGTDLFVVDVLVKYGDLIMVFIDSDTAVTIDKCVEVSRFIESHLNRDEEDFELRVSSSGLDHPLTMPRQLKKFVGKSLDIDLSDGQKIRCRLLEVNNDGLKTETLILKKINKIKKEEPAEIRAYTWAEMKTIRAVIDFS